ncbi:SDR family oxidoreductase [Gracilibacillus alcaliphilus]
MKLTVFGASGDTGIQLVEQLLLDGHKVVAVVRSPEKLKGKLKLSGTQLEIRKGDVLNPAVIQNTMTESDAVFSMLGASHQEPTTVYSQGIENIIHEMQTSGVNRLICLSAETLKSKQEASFKDRLILSILWKIFFNLYDDMQRMEQKVYQSEVDWTIIRPPRLTKGVKTDKYRIGINQPIPKSKGRVSHADLAACAMDQLDNPESQHSIVYVSD